MLTSLNRVTGIKVNKSSYPLGHFNPAKSNPWKGESNSAPFNKEFYLIFNVAVGGTNAYFPDGQGGKPWSNSEP